MLIYWAIFLTRRSTFLLALAQSVCHVTSNIFDVQNERVRILRCSADTALSDCLGSFQFAVCSWLHHVVAVIASMLLLFYLYYLRNVRISTSPFKRVLQGNWKYSEYFGCDTQMCNEFQYTSRWGLREITACTTKIKRNMFASLRLNTGKWNDLATTLSRAVLMVI